MTLLRFAHEFEDGSPDGMLSIDTDASLPAKIRMSVDAGGGFWMSANREGWLHIARVAAELGLGKFENGYHFHKDESFSWSTGGPEFSFERSDAL
jgi:hypothetical protein